MRGLLTEDFVMPRRIDTLRALNRRGALDNDLKSELYRLNQGALGEQFVFDCLKEFGMDHWAVVQNLWLELFGKFECDVFLTTENMNYTFEIKHYNGNFKYRNNQCFLDGKLIGHNAISQAQKSSINLQTILQQENINIKTKNVLVFTGEFCQVDIKDDVQDLDIIMRHQLRDYIRKIREYEQSTLRTTVNQQSVIEILNKYKVASPQFHEPIPGEILNRLKTGLLCPECSSLATFNGKMYMYYECGYHELIEEALVRTVNEYGVIYGKKYFTTKEIKVFINQILSDRTILKYLNKNFERIGNSRATKFLIN